MKIYDNIEKKLHPALTSSMRESLQMDSSVGYFNIRGWSLLSSTVDEMSDSGNESKPKVRLLIGMSTRPDEELREWLRISGSDTKVDHRKAQKMRETVLNDLRQQLLIGMPADSDESTIRSLSRQLQDKKVQVKLHLAHPLHAKLYLCHKTDEKNPTIGFVGSSNLTMAGIRKQGELNVDVLDEDDTKKLSEWFTQRWDDNLSIDISEELVKILDETWAEFDPYHIYLKIAYHLGREAHDGLLEYELPESMSEELLEYQASAVKIATRYLKQHGGVMIGDVVGLGKTIVATAIARLLQEGLGTETLIICPKNLVKMWEGYRDKYRLHGKVLSLSMVTRELDELRRHRVVIIDESHNLRSNTRKDYAALRDYIDRNDSKTILLTATPYNKQYRDVANQLGLFLDKDFPLGIQPDHAIMKAGFDDFYRRCEGKLQTLGAFAKSEEPEDWRRLMSMFLVRRTRKFIRDNYAEIDKEGRHFLRFADGSTFYFPERIAETLPHIITENDPSNLMTNEETFDTLDNLNLPRYNVVDHIDNSIEPTKQENAIIEDLNRGSGNLIGFTRTMFYKRLSSCPAAFILSLQRHLIRNRIFLNAIQNHEKLPIGRFDDNNLEDEDPDSGLPADGYPDGGDPEQWETIAKRAHASLKKNAPKKTRWLRSELLKASFKKDLVSDIEAIEGLLTLYGTWDQSNDSKLDALENLLKTRFSDEKVLIFTEYKDTAEYVADSLEKRGITKIESVSGSSTDPTAMARRFSPKANEPIGGLPKETEELRILVSTDILSEGQNLQDAHIVINFDLPWAIIRIIQRAGRIDRVGQRSPEVFVYTFLPNDDIENIIKLRERIAVRLKENAVVIGADERFFGDDSEIRHLEDLYAGTGVLDGLEDEDEEVDWTSMAYEIWREATENNDELASLVKAIPNVSLSTKESGPEGDEGVIVYTQTEMGYDSLAVTNTEGESKLLSPHEALRLTRCEPNTPRKPRLDRHHELVAQAVTGPLQTPIAHLEGALTGVRKRCWDRLVRHKTDVTGTLFDNDGLDEALDALYHRPLRESATQLLANALRERTPEEVADLIVMLHTDNRLCVDVKDIDEDELRIVCSMGLRNKT